VEALRYEWKKYYWGSEFDKKVWWIDSCK
jgi:hypothetical protein